MRVSVERPPAIHNDAISKMIIVQRILRIDDNDDWPSSSRMITHD